MIVDAYTTAGGYFIREDPMGLPQLFALMERTGVEMAAVIGTRALHADAKKGNDYLFSATARDPRVIPIGVLTPNSNYLDAPGLVADCVKSGAAGLAVFPGDSSFPLSSLSLRKTLAVAAKSGLPLIATAIRAPGVATQLAELTRDLECPLLLADSYYGLLDELLAVLEEHAHVYVDTSWQITPGCIELMVRHGGPNRVLFGSGAPVRPIQPALNVVLDADVDETTKRGILAGNALKLFGRHAEAKRLEAESPPLPEPRVPATRAIDVHGHLGVVPAIPLTVRDVDAVDRYAARADFEYVVCSASVAYREDLDWGNQEMLDKIKGRPRLLGSPVISPTHMDASIKWLDMCLKNDRLAHVTLDPDNEGEATGSPRYMALWAEAAKRGIPVFWNSGSQDLDRGVRWRAKLGYMPMVRGAARADIDMFLEVGRRHPELPVIIGHGMGEDGIHIAQSTRSIYLELSGSYPERGAVRKAIDEVGADRVVYGTDLDLIIPAFVLGVYYEADMSPQEERLVMAENARRILRMPRET